MYFSWLYVTTHTETLGFLSVTSITYPYSAKRERQLLRVASLTQDEPMAAIASSATLTNAISMAIGTRAGLPCNQTMRKRSTDHRQQHYQAHISHQPLSMQALYKPIMHFFGTQAKKYIIFAVSQAYPAPITPYCKVAQIKAGINNTTNNALPIMCSLKSPLANCR